MSVEMRLIWQGFPGLVKELGFKPKSSRVGEVVKFAFLEFPSGRFVEKALEEA